MKKILTVSLFAMMAVSAANADIASTNYVDTAKTAAISTAASDATTKANQAKADAISAAASDATSKANAAKEAAIAAIPAVDSTFNGDSNNAATSKAIATYVSSQLEVLNGEQEAINTSIGELGADIAAINHKDTGILAQAKADAKSKADAAQSAAESKVTALQNGAVKTNTDNITAMDKAYKDADTAIKNTIGTVTQGKTVVEMISDAQTSATYDDTAVRGLISGNTNEISAIKNSAYATSGVTSAVVNQVTTNKNDIAAINNESTGILAQAKADAKSKADAAQSAAESKVTALQNGAVKTNTDNITAMDEAYKAADAALDGRVDTLESDNTTNKSNITNLQTAVNNLNTGENSVSSQIANALEDYSTTTQMNTAITNNAVNTVVSGSANGTIAVDGQDVAVKGLGSAAYTPKTDYATSTQGTKADNAVARTQIGAAANFTIPDECKAENAVCSLVVRKGAAGWEKVIYQ